MITTASSGHEAQVGTDRGRDITDTEWGRYDQTVKSRVAALIAAEGKLPEARRDRSPLHQLGLCAFLLSLRDAEDLGKHKKQTLAQYDRDAYEVLELRHGLLAEKHATLLKNPTVAAALQKADAEAIRETLGDRVQRARDYRTHLLSDRLWDAVRSDPPKQRTERLHTCLLRLAALDPRAAEAVAQGWIAREVHADPVGVLQSVSTERAEAAATALLVHLERQIPPTVRSGHPAAPLAALQECLAQPAARTAIARGLTRSLQVPALRQQLQRCDAQAIYATLAHYDVRAGRFMDLLTRSDVPGRTLGSFFALWSIVAVAASFPLHDEAGELRTQQVTAGLQGALSLGANAGSLAKWVSERASSKLTVPSRALVVVGDALGVYLAARGMAAEQKNQDTVGVVANALLCVASVNSFALTLSLVCGGAACPPLLIASFAVILGAALLDGMFGESALTGTVRRHLDTLGITQQENDVRRSYDRTLRNTSRDSVRASAATSNLGLTQRLALINSCAKGKTCGYEEATIWKMFADTRAQPQAFIWLIESSDPARIAEELEDTNEACDVLTWTLRAYASAGRPPGRGFDQQLVALCKAHRWQPLWAFIDAVSDDPQLLRAYEAVAPETLRLACVALMDGHTGEGAETALCHLLAFASATQVEVLFKAGTNFARRVENELPQKQWTRVRMHVDRERNTAGARRPLEQRR